MAITSNAQNLGGKIASASLASSQFHFVKDSSTAGECKIVSATTDFALGVLQNKPAAGVEAEIQVSGLAKVIAGTSAGWSFGIAVGWNTTGRAVPLAANSTNDNRLIIGRFPGVGKQTTTVTIGQVISVQLIGGATRL